MSTQVYNVQNLQVNYVGQDKHSFKIVLNPKLFPIGGEFSSWKNISSDGKSIPTELNRWGRKINVHFTVDENVSDGVAQFSFTLNVNGKQHSGKLNYWIIK